MIPAFRGVQEQDVADIEVFARQFLHHDAFGDEVLAEAAELLRQRGADQTQIAHLPDQARVEGLRLVMGEIVGRQTGPWRNAGPPRGSLPGLR